MKMNWLLPIIGVSAVGIGAYVALAKPTTPPGEEFPPEEGGEEQPPEEPTPPATGDLTIYIKDNDTSTPIPNALVKITNPLAMSGYTDANGRVLFSGLPVEIYTIEANSALYYTQVDDFVVTAPTCQYTMYLVHEEQRWIQSMNVIPNPILASSNMTVATTIKNLTSETKSIEYSRSYTVPSGGQGSASTTGTINPGETKTFSIARGPFGTTGTTTITVRIYADGVLVDSESMSVQIV